MSLTAVAHVSIPCKSRCTRRKGSVIFQPTKTKTSKNRKLRKHAITSSREVTETVHARGTFSRRRREGEKEGASRVDRTGYGWRRRNSSHAAKRASICFNLTPQFCGRLRIRTMHKSPHASKRMQRGLFSISLEAERYVELN